MTCFSAASINDDMPTAQEACGPVLAAAPTGLGPVLPLRSVIFPAVCLILAGGVAYLNSFQAPFILDDEGAIVKNPTIRRLTHLGQVLAPPAGTTVEGRPVVNLSLAISYATGGLHVFHYHAMNLAVHILAALTLFGLVRRTLLLPRLRPAGTDTGAPEGPRLFGGGHRSRLFETDATRLRAEATSLALIVALLWLVHPLQTESVTYIIQRAEALMGLFYLLTLYLFVRGACPIQNPRSKIQNAWYVAAVVACALGMGTKEVMVSAPLMALLYDRTFLSGTFREALRRRWGCYAGLAATWLVLLAEMSSSGGHRQVIGLHFAELTPLHYAMTQCRFIVHYLVLALWPSDLVFDYGLADAGVPIIRTYAEWAPWGAVVLLLLCGTLLALRYLPEAGFLGVWFFLILAPTSSFVPIISQVAAEHRMYLPLAAVVAALVCGLTSLWALGNRLCRRPIPTLGQEDRSQNTECRSWHSSAFGVRQARFCLLSSVFCILALGAAYRTVQRNQDYQSRLRMWSLVVTQRPGNARALNNLGKILCDQGWLREGAAFLQEALKSDPKHANPDETAITHNNLGIILLRQGRLGEAIAHCQEALELRPGYPEAHYNLGNALFQQGKLDEAMTHYHEALGLRTEYAEAHTNLGAALFQQDRLDEAISHYREALKEMPEYVEAHNNLGAALVRQGKEAEAIAQFQEALRLKPDCREARENLEGLLKPRGQP